jgi:DNA-binding MarR family transcriptional regulator
MMHSIMGNKKSQTDVDLEAIRQSSRMFVRELGFFHKTFGDSQLTPAQCHMLLEIQKKKSANQNTLAKILNVDQSTASRNLKVLMKKGLLSGKPSPQDKRIKSLTLTKKGIEELKEYDKEARIDVLSAFSFLTDQERQICVQGLGLYALALKKANLKRGSRHELTTGIPEFNEIDDNNIRLLSALINKVYDEAESGMWKVSGSRTSPDQVKSLLKKKKLILAKLDGAIVGSVNVNQMDDNTAEFGMLVADQNFRGVGIGSILVDAAESWGKLKKCNVMQLELLTPRSWKHPSKEFLKKWYSRLGYKPESLQRLEDYHPDLVKLLATECDYTVWKRRL